MKKVSIGIDIGGTNTIMGIVDGKGEIIARYSIASETDIDYSIYMDKLGDAIEVMVEACSEPIQVMGIGVGAPNGNYYNGTIEFAPNLNFEGVVPVVSHLKARFDYEVIVLTNDANAAAMGEMMYGGAKGMRDFVMITLGTGVGSGIVVNGEMVYGLVAPGYEMAEILAMNLTGSNAQFTGADLSTKLKLMGIDVVSFGQYELPADQTIPLVYEDPLGGVYRKLFFVAHHHAFNYCLSTNIHLL